MGLETFLNGCRPCYDGPNFNGSYGAGPVPSQGFSVPDMQYFNNINYNQPDVPKRWPTVVDAFAEGHEKHLDRRTIAGLEGKESGNLLGGGIGALVGGVLGLFIPVIGPFIGAPLGAVLGGAAGYMLGGKYNEESAIYEYMKRDLDDNGFADGSIAVEHLA